ncbi:hypothetical protein SASPL_127797 [Salvia splendens]|uniref:PITH domain-containing protein n=1 Tax=Salvia splendens TaxID=180675 RepID=A0A8X8X8C7_SALSN|nr:hypothetical protein SASPL_127797 [Salvia splendens]
MPQGYLESNEGDPELIVFIPFTSDVKLKSISIVGGADGTSPAKMRAFINREGIDFSDAQNMQAVQEWDLAENLQGVLEYQTRYSRFRSVGNLTLHFPVNFGGDASTTQILNHWVERRSYSDSFEEVDLKDDTDLVKSRIPVVQIVVVCTVTTNARWFFYYDLDLLRCFGVKKGEFDRRNAPKLLFDFSPFSLVGFELTNDLVMLFFPKLYLTTGISVSTLLLYNVEIDHWEVFNVELPKSERYSLEQKKWIYVGGGILFLIDQASGWFVYHLKAKKVVAKTQTRIRYAKVKVSQADYTATVQLSCNLGFALAMKGAAKEDPLKEKEEKDQK